MNLEVGQVFERQFLSPGTTQSLWLVKEVKEHIGQQLCDVMIMECYADGTMKGGTVTLYFPQGGSMYQLKESAVTKNQFLAMWSLLYPND